MPSQARGGLVLPLVGPEGTVNGSWRSIATISPYAAIEQTSLFVIQSKSPRVLTFAEASLRTGPFRLLGHALDSSRVQQHVPSRTRTATFNTSHAESTTVSVATSDGAAALANGVSPESGGGTKRRSDVGAGAGAPAQPRNAASFVSLATRQVPPGHDPSTAPTVTSREGRRHFPVAASGGSESRALIVTRPASSPPLPFIIIHGDTPSGDGPHASPRVPLASRLTQGVRGVVVGVAVGLTVGFSQSVSTVVVGASSAVQSVAHGASAAAASFAHAAAHAAHLNRHRTPHQSSASTQSTQSSGKENKPK